MVMARGPYHKSDITRGKILNAATELFSQHGYAGTGVDRLAERSGIAKTAIYYHFGNKEGLLAAVVERAADLWINQIGQSAQEAETPEEALDRAIAGMQSMVEERSWILKLLILLTLEVADDKPVVRKSMSDVFHRARSSMVAGVEGAMGMPVPDAEMIGNVVLGLLQSIVVARELDPDASIDASFAELRAIMINMVIRRLEPAISAQATGEEAADDPVVPEPPVGEN